MERKRNSSMREKKGFLDFFHNVDADFFCLQETKLQEGQIELELPGYYQFWNYAERKGYSGTAIFTKQKPLSVVHGIGEEMEDLEGRVITLEYDHYYVVTMYTPNSKRDLTRLPYRILWEKQARAYLSRLNQDKPVIFCGDLNVAHTEKDVKNDRANIATPVLLMKSGTILKSCFKLALLIRIAIFTLKKMRRSHGGLICLVYVIVTLAGVLIIS